MNRDSGELDADFVARLQSELENIRNENKELTTKVEELEEDKKLLGQEVIQLKERIDELESENETLENNVCGKEEEIDKKLVFPIIENTSDELKGNVCARLFKNLTLTQLENLEKSAKENFAAQNRNYVLEIP